MRPLRYLAALTAAALLGPLFTAVPAAADTDFERRYAVNQRGAIVRAANSVVTCTVGLSATAPACGAARKGGNASNNSYAFDYIDVDGDSSTFDSSSADLTVPASATVTHAQLYWGANLQTTRDTPGLPAGNRKAPDADQRGEVKLKTPGGAYQSLTADAVYDLPIGRDPAYQARLDVTGIVKAAGSGTYTLADVQAARGSSDLGAFAGWTLVVAYKDSGEDLRNLTIYDGLRLMERFKDPIDIDLAGFNTPAAGPVNARLGAVVYDGDRTGSGDRMKIKTENGPSTEVSDGAHPAANVFNSSITALGTDTGDRDPDYTNTLGYDSSVHDVSKAFRNDDKRLRVSLSTQNENYAPGVIFLQIDLYESHAKIAKSAKVVGGGDAVPGSVIEYTVKVTGDGDDPATKVRVTDAMPANTTYVPGSLKVDGDARTDDEADDTAEYDGSGERVVFRVGKDADATTGGVLAKGESATLTFRVKTTAAAQSTIVKNTAKLSYTAKTLGDDFTDEASADVPVRDFADLEIAKSGPRTADPGDTVAYKVTVTNKGPDEARRVKVTDIYTGGTPTDPPPECTESVDGIECDLGDLPVGETRTLTFKFTIPADAEPGAKLADTVKVESATLDPDKANNEAKASTEVVGKARVEVTKSGPSRGRAGAPIDYVITVLNPGPGGAGTTRTADVVPAEIRKVTWTCTAERGAKCYTRSGKGNHINVLTDMPGKGKAIIKVHGNVAPGARGKTIKNTVRAFLPAGVVSSSPKTQVSTAWTTVTSKPVPPKPHPKPKPPKKKKKHKKKHHKHPNACRLASPEAGSQPAC